MDGGRLQQTCRFESAQVLEFAGRSETLVEEDAHAMIDVATGDDGIVDMGVLGDIIDELQHGASQGEAQNPPMSLSRNNVVKKYAAISQASSTRRESLVVEWPAEMTGGAQDLDPQPGSSQHDDTSFCVHQLY